jgi:hypothetical protein
VEVGLKKDGKGGPGLDKLLMMSLIFIIIGVLGLRAQSGKGVALQHVEK